MQQQQQPQQPQNQHILQLEKQINSLNLSKLSISEFAQTKKGVLNSKNAGVVEIMALHLCDKCIYSKTKLAFAMQMSTNHAKELHPSMSMFENVTIVLETDDAKQTTTVQRVRGLVGDKDTIESEKTLSKDVSIFSHFLWRYNLMNELREAIRKKGIYVDTESTLDWRQVSFTMIRRVLTEIFSRKNKKMDLEGKGPRKRVASLHDLTGSIKLRRSFSGQI